MKCSFYGKINEKNPLIFLTTSEGVKINHNLIFNVKNEVSPKLLKIGRFTILSVFIMLKLTKKIHRYFLTTFEGVKINQNLILNVKNEVLPKLLKKRWFY